MAKIGLVVEMIDGSRFMSDQFAIQDLREELMEQGFVSEDSTVEEVYSVMTNTCTQLLSEMKEGIRDRIHLGKNGGSVIVPAKYIKNLYACLS